MNIFFYRVFNKWKQTAQVPACLLSLTSIYAKAPPQIHPNLSQSPAPELSQVIFPLKICSLKFSAFLTLTFDFPGSMTFLLIQCSHLHFLCHYSTSICHMCMCVGFLLNYQTVLQNPSLLPGSSKPWLQWRNSHYYPEIWVPQAEKKTEKFLE